MTGVIEELELPHHTTAVDYFPIRARQEVLPQQQWCFFFFFKLFPDVILDPAKLSEPSPPLYP